MQVYLSFNKTFEENKFLRGGGGANQGLGGAVDSPAP